MEVLRRGAIRRDERPASVRHSTRSSRCDDRTDTRYHRGRSARHGVLRLTFADGIRGEVEVIGRMRGPVFEHARTPTGFAEVTVDTESGTVVWPGGADLAPDTLYVRIKTGAWPGADLAA